MTQPLPLSNDLPAVGFTRPLRWWQRLLALVCCIVVIGFGVGVLFAASYDIAGGEDPEVLDSVTGIGLIVGVILGACLGALWRGARWQARKFARSAADMRAGNASSSALAPSMPGGQKSAWPTMLTTLVLSPLVGWIPALIQGRRARRSGMDESYYWKAYAAAVVLSVALGLALKVIGGP